MVVRVPLVRIVHQGTVVGAIHDTIVVSIRVTRIADAIVIRILLTRIRHQRAVVHLTTRLCAVQLVVWPAIEIPVGATERAIACPAQFTFATVRERAHVLALGMLIADGAVRTDARNGLTDSGAIHSEASVASTLVRSFGVHTVRVSSAINAHRIALIDVCAGLATEEVVPERGANPLSVLPVKARWTRVALESGR